MKLTPTRYVAMVAMVLCLLAAGWAGAQSFPIKPLRITVPSAAGGGSDLPARAIAAELEKRFGQPVLVENRPGAGMTIAAKAVATAAPDGYTLYFAGVLSPHPIFSPTNSVDAKRDFAPISNLVSFGALYLMVSSKLPVKTFQELVAYSKANPKKLNYANVTPSQRLSMAMLRNRTGLSTTTISYKEDPQVIRAFLAGEADVAMMVGTAYMRELQEGSLRALFVAAPRRSSLLPDVPTAAEAGVPGFEVVFNAGLWAPVGTPEAVIQKLNAEANAAVKSPSVVKQLRSFGAEPLGSTPEEQLRIFEADVKFFVEAARLPEFTSN